MPIADFDSPRLRSSTMTGGAATRVYCQILPTPAPAITVAFTVLLASGVYE